MAFLNIPIKSIQLNLVLITPKEMMPWYNPNLFPVAPGNPSPDPELRAYRWEIVCDVSPQTSSSYVTRKPGAYDGQDIAVGQWIANTSSGAAWQIISIVAKTALQVTMIVQDVYRYNTFRDVTQQGDGSPPLGYYVAFNVSDSGVPQIDPIPEVGVSSNFFTNLLSRFEYINLQYDYPLYQEGNTFQINDVIGTNSTTHQFELASDGSRIPVGRVTSVSDLIPGWFTINPVQKITDFMDSLPGDVGDIIYTDVNSPGSLTLNPGGSQMYLKIRNNTQSITVSAPDAVTSPGNVFKLNGVEVTLVGAGDLDDLVSSASSVSSSTGVTVTKVLADNVATSNSGSLSSTYGEILLAVSAPFPSASINGITVTVSTSSTDAGYSGYARAADIAKAINNANVPNIVASSSGVGNLTITNTSGGAITITNIQADVNGVNFAGSSSGTGIPLSTPASTQHVAKFVAVDSRPIEFLDVVGSPSEELGLVSVENGVKACGMYIANGLRSTTCTVVADIAARDTLNPLVGDQAYVLSSSDGEWALYVWGGSSWTKIADYDSSNTDAKSLSATVNFSSTSPISLGNISDGARVVDVTVIVTTPFNDAGVTISVGYPTAQEAVMVAANVDPTQMATYENSTSYVNTSGNEQELFIYFNPGSATAGQAKVIVSYL